nr:YfhO family protein [Bacteroidota bacterium]
GSISLTDYNPNHLTYSYQAESEQLVVFSEIYYDKGWNAFIDGVPAEHFRVNYVLRAMRIPEGSHSIEFKFEPSSYIIGEYIALAGSILSILFIGFAIYWETKKKQPEVKNKA